jgi:hypothetical protein
VGVRVGAGVSVGGGTGVVVGGTGVSVGGEVRVGAGVAGEHPAAASSPAKMMTRVEGLCFLILRFSLD